MAAVLRLLLFTLLAGASSEDDAATGSGESKAARWFIVPADDLAAIEAFEFALVRINEMREQCEGFKLAPVRRQDYVVEETFVQDMGLYSNFRLDLEPVHGLVPTEVNVEVSRMHSVTDLSLFEVTKVTPSPCYLYSAVDDAELMVSWKSKEAQEASKCAMALLNAERGILCPQRPELQLLRVVAAAVQPAEGIVVRVQLELRESSSSFSDKTFVDQVAIIYSLDRDVPGQCTISPEIYPGRSACEMRYAEEEQTALTEDNETSVERRIRRRLRQTNSSSAKRRLSWDPTAASEAAAAAGSHGALQRPFVEAGLHLPDNFDPRLERTICFPRGISRRQGACGAGWAFAATAVTSFRECLWKLKEGDESASLEFYSAQELLSCGAHNGCSGGSAGEAFYYMKQKGIAREACSAYRMRCFNDESALSVPAADLETSVPMSGQTETEHFSQASCPKDPDLQNTRCKCLPSVFHLTKTLECELLPDACPKVHLPHYFKLAGLLEGNTVPQLERHMMQELLADGPLSVSILLYEDFYDPVSWTESGIYIHKRGALVGRHSAVTVGWGTDLNSRDYWLLLNSFGNAWQQEGYFKVLRGPNSLKLLDFGAWGGDWKPKKDKSRPSIFDVEVAFAPVPVSRGAAAPLLAKLAHVWLRVSAATDEPSRLLVRVKGLSSGITGEARDSDFDTADAGSGGEGGQRHVLRIDLLQLGLLDDRLEVQLWAADQSQNSGRWGPVTLSVPDKATFQHSLSGDASRRLAADFLQANASQETGPILT